MDLLVVLLGGTTLLAVFAVALTRPVAWLQASVFLIILGPFMSRLWPSLSSADELAIAVTVAVAIARLVGLKDVRMRRFPGGFWFALFGAAGVLSGLFAGAPGETILAGGFLALKSVAYGWAAAQYDIDWARIPRIGASAWMTSVVMVLVSVALNFALAGLWFKRFSNGGGSERGGIASPVGVLVHPGYLAQGCALLILCLIAGWLLNVRLPGPRLVFGVLLLVVLVLTLRRKAIVGVAVALAVSIIVAQRRRSTTLLALVGGLVVVTVIAGPQILDAYHATTRAYIVNSGTSPRFLLYQGGFELANWHWPFGAGFGRYGSAVAVENYSPVYYQLGFDQVYGLAKGDDYGQDAFWPAVVGEAGWLGLVSYSFGLLGVLSFFYRLARLGRSDSVRGYIGLLGVLWWFEFLTESVASPVYLAAPLGPLLFLLCGVGVAVEASGSTTRRSSRGAFAPRRDVRAPRASASGIPT